MKKLLLFFSFVLFASYTSFAQVPVNDLIVNATEITTYHLSESNLRLDLASTSAGGQNVCNVSGFKVVYYKFTANSVATLTATLQDQNSGTISQSFLIFYTAADLNVTDETQLSDASVCSFGTTATLSTIAGQSYYLLVHREDANQLSKVEVIHSSIPTSERDALIDLYNATDGPNWVNSTNWNTATPVATWSGVTVENGHVVQLNLFSNNLSGLLPNTLTNLTFLETANFNTNNLTGEVPDLSSISTLTNYAIFRNNYVFGDLETNFINNSTILYFSYSGQNSIDTEIIIDAILGSNYNFTVSPVSGTNVQYQWVRERLQTFELEIPISGATTTSYSITNAQETDFDNYSVIMTSAIIPDLILRRSSIKLRVPVSQSEKDALIAIYNALDGPNWVDNTNWLSIEHADDWKGITTIGGKVTSVILNFNGLNGQLPNEIGDLIYLKQLRISINPNLTGPIPASIGNLTELEFLRLQNNDHSGDLPASIVNLTNLKRLYLQDNSFTGELLIGLGNATQMFQIFIDNNQFSGEIPASFSNFTELVSFSLVNNNFSGILPSELQSMSSLLLTDLRGNDFYGPIPDWSGISGPTNASFNFSDNFFDFSDLEPFINNGTTYASLIYSPQRTQDLEETIDSLPGADITLNVNDTNINRNSNDTAMNNEYQWYKDNVAISGANANSFTIINSQETDSGIYYCDITNALVPDLTIRRADITLNIDPNLSVNEINNNDFKIYPNPVTNWITIQLQNPVDANIKIYDLNGRLILENSIQTEITSFAVDTLHAGTYLISVTSNNNLITKRFIKQ